MGCRAGRKNCAGTRFLSIQSVVAFDRRAMFCQNFKHLLMQTDVWTPTVRKLSRLCSQFSVHISSQNCFLWITFSGQFPFLSVWMTIRVCIWIMTKTLNGSSTVAPEIIVFTSVIMNKRWAANKSYCRYIVILKCNGLTHRKSSYWSYDPIKSGF